MQRVSTQPFADKAWSVLEAANDLGDRATVKVVDELLTLEVRFQSGRPWND
jgi:hypothetical protein